MPPSQLKRLKADLHTRRSSQNQKRKKPQSKAPTAKTTTFASKKETSQQKAYRLRASTLLPELQRRNKVGSYTDRRIGEDDPTLAPAEKARRRAIAQLGGGGKRSKRNGIFNLEDDDSVASGDEGEQVGLTHLGRPLVNGNAQHDDYEDDDHFSSDDEPQRKKLRLTEATEDVTGKGADDNTTGKSLIKKSKKEVMEEVIAKSKFHKYERQQAKEEHEDLRDELDSAMPDLLAALSRHEKTRIPPPPTDHVETSPKSNGVQPGVHPDRAAMMDLKAVDYDQQVRQMTQERKAQPSTRSKTAEEKAMEEAERLKKMEQDRLERMRGEKLGSNDEDAGEGLEAGEDVADVEEGEDEAAAFGFATARSTKLAERDVEFEDDFVIDEGLVASGSEIDSDAISNGEESDSDSDQEILEEEDDDAEFLKDVLPYNEGGQVQKANAPQLEQKELPYTYACPQNHDDLAKILNGIPFEEHPTVIQRIRALYHPQLNPANKQKLARFSSVLVEYISYMGFDDSEFDPPLDVVGAIIRHVHSLARTYPDEVSRAFRAHLSNMRHRPQTMSRGDLLILTAIGSIFPTSDHFHQVVTPATLLAARWLGTTSKLDLTVLKRGAYLVDLLARYQKLSRRYIPETIHFTLSALHYARSTSDPAPLETITLHHITNIATLADLWSSQTAFIEIFSPDVTSTLSMLSKTSSSPAIRTLAKTTLKNLKIQLRTSQLARRPLELHHHKPLPIKTAIPAFEDTDAFHPAKRYDPDPERSASARLKKEVKKETRAAVRELRRDAEFIGREKLRDKKERDRAYEEKQRSLIRGIQGDEARDEREYQKQKKRAKRMRF